MDSLTISESTFLQNSAVVGSGGGIYCTMSLRNLNSAFMAIIASMFSQNSATDGGGVDSAVSLVTMRESTFSANYARRVSLSFIGTTFVHMRTWPDTFPWYTPWQVFVNQERCIPIEWAHAHSQNRVQGGQHLRAESSECTDILKIKKSTFTFSGVAMPFEARVFSLVLA